METVYICRICYLLYEYYVCPQHDYETTQKQTKYGYNEQRDITISSPGHIISLLTSERRLSRRPDIKKETTGAEKVAWYLNDKVTRLLANKGVANLNNTFKYVFLVYSKKLAPCCAER